ncbi:MAG: hypothetical protein KKE31_03625, partial [Planctomycetes bacterium]|nr:hypothetical protein [Planctomycetota bacterium]
DLSSLPASKNLLLAAQPPRLPTRVGAAGQKQLLEIPLNLRKKKPGQNTDVDINPYRVIKCERRESNPQVH